MYKTIVYLTFIAISFHVFSLIVFDLFMEQNIAYFLYLGIITLTFIILSIFYLFSYIKCFRPLNKIFEQNFSQKIPLKS